MKMGYHQRELRGSPKYGGLQVDRKVRSRIAAVMLLTVMLAGLFEVPGVCAQEEQGEKISGSIKVTFNLVKSEVQKYIEGFEQKYPGVEVTYECIDDYENALMERLPAGDYGDVLFVPGFLDYREIPNYFAPLGYYNQLTAKYNYIDSGYSSENLVYTIPSSAYLMGVAYNKDVFYKAGISSMPKSIDAFIDDMAMIRERTDAVPVYLNSAFDWTIRNWVDFPYAEMTGDPAYKGSKFVCEKDPFTEGGTYYAVYQMLYDLEAGGYTEGIGNNVDWDVTCKDLNEGRCGCIFIGSWALSQVKAAGRNKDSIGFMPFPNEIGGKQYATLNTDYCYAVKKDSENVDTAKAFVEYLLDESGYALNRELISIVKTDPYSDTYSNMEDVVPVRNESYTGDNYSIYQNMLQAIDPTDADELRRILNAAKQGSESFDQIMQEWNRRWEDARPDGMTLLDRSETLALSAAAQAEDEAVDSQEEGFFKSDYNIMFSPTENEYIGSKKSLRVGYLRGYAPFQYEVGDELSGQRFEGLCAVMCQTIADNTNLELVYTGYDSEEELVQALESGELDMAAGVQDSPLYTKRIKFSREYIEYINVLMRNDTIEMNQLEGSRQAVVFGGNNTIRPVDKFDTVRVDSIAEAVRQINARDVEYGVANYYSAEYYMRDQECEHVVVVPLTEKTKLGFAFANDVDSRLIAICNKCIYSIPEDTVQMVLLQNMDSAAKPVTFARFVKENPFTAVMVGLGILLLMAGALLAVWRERRKSRRKRELDNRRYAILSHLTDEYVFEYDLRENAIHFEEKFEKKFDFERDIRLADYANDRPALNCLIENCNRAKENEATTTDDFELEDCAGAKQWYRMIAYRIAGEDGQPSHLIGKIVNVQETVEEKQRIQDVADRDALTGLYNRTGYEKRVHELSLKYGEDVSVIFAVLDLDNFKSVNDSMGHAGGDEALRLLAGRLDRMSGENTVVARYGGDEFIVCMFGVGQADGQAIFETLVEGMNTEMNYQGHLHHLSISLGAVYTAQALPPAALFVEADKVLYDVKAAGKNGFRLVGHGETI